MTHTTPQVHGSFPVEVTGASSAPDQQYAVEKIRSLTPYAARQIRRAHITLETAGARARAERIRVAAHLDIDGRVVNATATGATAQEAIDGVRQRLYAQLARRRRPLRAASAWVSRPLRRL